MDSEFGLVFYSYLSIGTLNLNLKFASGGPAGALLHCSPTFAPSSQRTALSVRGLCYTVRRPLLLRRKGRLSVLMIRFRWVRSKPFAPSSQSMAQPSLCGHQQQQACNTIKGYWFPHHGPSARNPQACCWKRPSAVLRGFRVWFSVL